MRTASVFFVSALFVTVPQHASEAPRSTTQASGLPLAAQSSISSSLGRDTARYQAHRKRGRFEVENPQHELVADFTSRGVEIRRGVSHLRLALQGYGYGSAIKIVGRVFPVARRNRVEYRRGSMTEWYENGPLGLEQGFTINEPPGKANSQPLTVVLSVSGDLNAADAEQQGLEFAGHDGKAVLRYSALSAYDATGRQLKAWEELQNGRLLLSINDTDARYPVVVDPWVQLAELTASVPAQAAQLGYSIAMNGNTIVVGAPFDTVGANFTQGAVYVFVEPPTGWANMTETARLTASDGTVGDVLGEAVAIGGNTIVAGAAGANLEPNELQGAAYVFVKPANGWSDATETAKLTASDGATDDFFGSSVSISGDTVAIGADGATIGSNPYQGAVYFFVEPPSGWITTSSFAAKVTTSDGAAGDQFGYSLSLNTDTLVVGARSATIGSNMIEGAAYAFSKPRSGWVTTSAIDGKLSSADGASGDLLGSSISISGDNTVAAAAPNATVGANTQQGALYVFVEPSSGWSNMTQTAKLTAAAGKSNDQLGFNVSISPNGKNIVAGAPGNSSGEVYIYSKPAQGWVDEKQIAKVTASGGTGAAWLGFGVAVAGGTVVGSAPCTTVSNRLSPPIIFGPNLCQGALYLFSQ
jgi:hypothetical protein